LGEKSATLRKGKPYTVGFSLTAQMSIESVGTIIEALSKAETCVIVQAKNCIFDQRRNSSLIDNPQFSHYLLAEKDRTKAASVPLMFQPSDHARQ
jgi:hypothetical protein